MPTSVSAPDPLPNLTTWATLAPDGTLKVAIDDLAIAGPKQPISISVPGYAVSGEEPLPHLQPEPEATPVSVRRL